MELIQWALPDIIFLIGLFLVIVFFIRTKNFWILIFVLIIAGVGWFMILSPFIALIFALFGWMKL